jgi:hypothetical protein
MLICPVVGNEEVHKISSVRVNNGLVNNGAPDEGKAEKFELEGGG